MLEHFPSDPGRLSLFGTFLNFVPIRTGAGELRSRWGARKASVLAAALVALGLALGSPPAAAGFDQDPILFVHGIEGSGAQFESQKMRFMSNGYPEQWVDAVDYDSTRAVADRSQVHAQIDAKIAELKRRTGRPKVDVVAHSLGTIVMYDYLTRGPRAAERRASVDRYINVDGQSSNPGVPTLAVWAGRGRPGRRMEGAANVTIPNQTHVQACTSAEAFVEYHRFLTGRAPAHDIVPQTGPIEVAGRALLFPQNTGLPTTSALEVWPVDAKGRRTGTSPAARVALDSDGNFGPLRLEAGRRYELVVSRPNVATLHYYYEPFVRSDYMLRLLYSDVVETLVQRSERHAAGLVLRYKELWGDQGAQNDVLSFNGTNVCNAAICPISKQVNAVFYYDRGLDGRTDLSRPDPLFSGLPFITGVDVFLPAARPPNGTVSVSLRSRGGGPVRTLSYPNFPSTTDGAVLQFNDFETVGPGKATDRVLPRVAVAGIRGRRRCTRRSFTLRVRIRESHLARADVLLDGRRIARRRSRRFRVRIRARSLRRGRHRITVIARDRSGNRRIVRRSFRRCARRGIAPRFTG